jgi:hypothetical protein
VPLREAGSSVRCEAIALRYSVMRVSVEPPVEQGVRREAIARRYSVMRVSV